MGGGHRLELRDPIRDTVYDAGDFFDRQHAMDKKWAPIKDGTVATRASVTSPGATNMRVGVQVDSPPEAEIRFFGADLTATHPVVTREDISWKGPEPQTLWSPIVEGQTIGIEIVLPSEESLSDFRFEIDGVLHGFLENGGFGTPRRGEADP